MDTEYLQNKYRFNKIVWAGSLYYDHPDGEDLAGKLSFCGKVAFFVSTPIGVYNSYVSYPFATTYLGRLFKIASVVVPTVGMALAFATGTYYATRIRQKDDLVNHAIGGASAAVILGAARGLHYGIFGGIYLAGLAGTIKHLYSSRHEVVYTRGTSPYLRRLKDMSGIPYEQGNWVKGHPPKE